MLRAHFPICVRCRRDDHQLPPCNGPCPCPVDGRPILEAAKAGECPAGKFDPAPPPEQNAAGRTPRRKCGGVKLKAAVEAKAGGCGSCGAKKAGLLGTIAHGAVGLAKVAMQEVGIPIDAAPDALVAARLAACAACPNLKGSRCAICTCFVDAKARLLSEDCPAGKW